MFSLPVTAAAAAAVWSSLRPRIRYNAHVAQRGSELQLMRRTSQAHAAIGSMHDTSLGGRLIFVREDRCVAAAALLPPRRERFMTAVAGRKATPVKAGATVLPEDVARPVAALVAT